MSKNFKSPVSTISPRGQRFDFVDKSGKRRCGFVPPLPPEKTRHVGTDAHFPAHGHIPVPPSVNEPEFKGLFWSNVKKGAGCWEWQASKRRGYGKTRIPGSRALFSAHRLAYFFATGEDPGEMLVCHTCDNPGCVRPDHLFLGTDADNSKDMVAKGRHRSGPTAGARNGNAKLSEADARLVIRALMAGESNMAISRRYPIGHALVSRIRTGKAWRPLSAAMGYTPAPSKCAPKSGRTAFAGARPTA